MKNWTVYTEEDDNGDVILPFPQDMIDLLGWQIGDVIEFKDAGPGKTELVNKTKIDRDSGCIKA